MGFCPEEASANLRRASSAKNDEFAIYRRYLMSLILTCKKLTSVRKRHVVEVFATYGQIGGRIETGESAEVMDEMRLIEITAG